MKKFLLPMLVTATTISNAFAGFAIPDTRKDQTFTNESVAASSFKERKNVSLSYNSFTSESDDYDQEKGETSGSFIYTMDGYTLESNISSTSADIDYDGDDESYDLTSATVALSKLITESLSVGAGYAVINDDSEEDSSSQNQVYLSSVFKLNNKHYFGAYIQHSTPTDDDEPATNLFLVAFGQRFEYVDYEVAMYTQPEASEGDNEETQSNGFLGRVIGRVPRVEILGALRILSTESESSATYEYDFYGSSFLLRPEVMLSDSLYLGVNFEFGKYTFEYESGYEYYQSVSSYQFYGRYMVNQFQIWAGIGTGKTMFSDDFESLSDFTATLPEDRDNTTAEIKLSYLF